MGFVIARIMLNVHQLMVPVYVLQVLLEPIVEKRVHLICLERIVHRNVTVSILVVCSLNYIMMGHGTTVRV